MSQVASVGCGSTSATRCTSSGFLETMGVEDGSQRIRVDVGFGPLQRVAHDMAHGEDVRANFEKEAVSSKHMAVQSG